MFYLYFTDVLVCYCSDQIYAKYLSINIELIYFISILKVVLNIYLKNI